MPTNIQKKKKESMFGNDDWFFLYFFCGKTIIRRANKQKIKTEKVEHLYI